jgi:excisionase family DNA binding protein
MSRFCNFLSSFVVFYPNLIVSQRTPGSQKQPLRPFGATGMAFAVTRVGILMSAFQELSLLTLAEAATILQLSKRTLLRMIQQRQVPAFKVGGQWRIRESQFRRWVEGKENGAAEFE